jgi:riboflavin kinase/FMN adenylyltransferase
MRTLTSLESLAHETAPVVLAAGVFDGVHLGHQAVIAQAQGLARTAGGQAWVLTFDPHPLKILKPHAAPALLTSTPHKLQLLGAQRVEGCIVLPFTAKLAALEPETFIRQLHAAVPHLAGMVVGANWTFGHRARGDVGLLKALAAELGFAVAIVDGITWNGKVVSSTRIRHAVHAGHLQEAADMLGRPFSMFGTVVHGKKLGRALGFRTANVNPHNEVHPPPGIYAVRAVVQQRVYDAAAYLSNRESRVHAPGIVEVHIMDQDLNLYDSDMEILFIRQLRKDHAFTDPNELKAQIAMDIEEIRRILAS